MTKPGVKPETKVMGRPLTQINWDIVSELCEIQCTEDEIAQVLKISVDTLYRACKREYDCTFADFFKKNSSRGKSSLRRAQYQKAIDGNPTMLIWLGKQWLGQKEQMILDENDQPIALAYDPHSLPKPK